MFTLRPRPVRLLVLCWLALAASSTATAKKPPPDDPPPLPPVKYQIVWLPDLAPDSTARTFDINSLGTVVGFGGYYGGNWRTGGRAVRWDVATGFACEDLNDVLSDLIPENHMLGTAECISNAGHIVGSITDQSGEWRIYAYHPLPTPHITMVDFPDSSYDKFYIYDVNDDGTVVGWRDPDGLGNGEDPTGAVWFSAAGPTAVELPSSCALTGINNDGVIVGLAWEQDGCPAGEVFLVNSSTLDQREYLGKRTALACGRGFGWPVINDQDTAAARVYAGRHDRFLYGCYYLAGQWTMLTEKYRVMVSGINNQGDIVGWHNDPKPGSKPHPGYVYLTGENGLIDGQYWELDEQIVVVQEGVDDLWLTGDEGSTPSIADVTLFTDPNGTGYSMISGNKAGYPYVLVPVESLPPSP